MNNLEYLNQISKTSRPVSTKTSTQGFGTIIKIAIAGAVIFVALLIIGALVNNNSDKTATIGPQIYLRTTNLEKTITTYNRSLRSSKLRAIGLTLSSTLTAAINQMDTTGLKNAAAQNRELTASETEYTANLDSTLNTAKLNGMLDRTYANQIQLQTSLLLVLIEQAINHTTDESLKGIYTQFQTNLSTTNTDLVNYSSND